MDIRRCGSQRQNDATGEKERTSRAHTSRLGAAYTVVILAEDGLRSQRPAVVECFVLADFHLVQHPSAVILHNKCDARGCSYLVTFVVILQSV